jgi:hypothetical protein
MTSRRRIQAEEYCMKRTLCQICLSTFFLLAVFSFCLASETSGPRIYIDEPTFDAKDIKSAEYLEHAFKVINKGDSALEISDVKPG